MKMTSGAKCSDEPSPRRKVGIMEASLGLESHAADAAPLDRYRRIYRG